MSILSKIKAWMQLTYRVIFPKKSSGQRYSFLNNDPDDNFAYLKREVEEFMIPRGKMATVDENASLTSIWKMIKREDTGCLPVYRQSKDNIVKIISVADVVHCLLNPKADLKELGEEPVFLPLHTTLLSVVDLISKHKIIIIVDEHGGTHGVITYTKLSQLVFESITDYYSQQNEKQSPTIKKCGANVFEVSADTPIAEIEKRFNIAITAEDEDVDTIGGAVFQVLERVPSVGEKFMHPAGFYVHILEAEPRCIKKLRLCLIEDKKRKN